MHVKPEARLHWLAFTRAHRGFRHMLEAAGMPRIWRLRSAARDTVQVMTMWESIRASRALNKGKARQDADRGRPRFRQSQAVTTGWKTRRLRGRADTPRNTNSRFIQGLDTQADREKWARPR